MTTLSRRQFLTFAGVTLLGLSPERFFGAALDLSASYGRTLEVLPVYTKPDIHEQVLKPLWADSVVQIIDVRGDWLQLSDGYVERSRIQPMTPYTPTSGMFFANAPIYAEVAAPVAPVYRWAAVDAPLVTRVGHGGVLRVVNALPNGWYAVEAVGDEVLGWTQAILWCAANDDRCELAQARVEIDTLLYMLRVYDGENLVLSTPFTTSAVLAAGTYVVERKQAGVTQITDYGTFHGAPWLLGFGGYELIGAYWHNQFGKPYAGNAVQLSPLAARWLYRQMNVGDSVVVTT